MEIETIILMLGISYSSELLNELKKLEKETFNLDEISECAMKASKKLSEDFKTKKNDNKKESNNEK